MALANMVPSGQAIRVSFGVSGIPEFTQKLERLKRLCPQKAAECVKRTALDIESEAKQNITSQGAVDTGITRANILQWSDDGYATASIGVSASKVTVTHMKRGDTRFAREDKSKIALIAAVIEFGHGVITPVRAKMLRWFDKSGNPVFARRVGPVPPRPFLHPAFEAKARDMIPRIREAIMAIAGGGA